MTRAVQNLKVLGGCGRVQSANKETALEIFCGDVLEIVLIPNHGFNRSDESMIIVTGPSLTRLTFISV